MPVEGADLDAAAGGSFYLIHQVTANKVLKTGRTCPIIKANESNRQQNRCRGHSQRKMAQEEAAQAARSGSFRLCNRLRRVGHRSLGGNRRRGFKLAHAPPFPAPPWASRASSDGSSTSTSPCLRRFLSQSSKDRNSV